MYVGRFSAVSNAHSEHEPSRGLEHVSQKILNLMLEAQSCYAIRTGSGKSAVTLAVHAKVANLHMGRESPLTPAQTTFLTA